MTQPEGHHLAEFKLGNLKYDREDPRVQESWVALIWLIAPPCAAPALSG